MAIKILATAAAVTLATIGGAIDVYTVLPKRHRNSPIDLL